LIFGQEHNDLIVKSHSQPTIFKKIMPKGVLRKAASVSFSDEKDYVFEIPILSQADVPSLFYSTDEIHQMKEAALMEMYGVADSVSAEGKNLFEVEGGISDSTSTTGQFRRHSLQKVSKSDLSPIRTARGKSESKPQETAVPAGREPRERPKRERGAPQRSRSSAGPSRTDGRRAVPGGGRGPPRRAKSSFGTSKPGEAVSLQQMQAQLAATGTSMKKT
jgi:hypothetical protein